ncbi:MFS transporter [Rhodococcus jostii]|uniref:Sugar phosphate permease n=1 Tax=Rhodococcus jostii TaxID=132919 RepID=A0A1H4ZCY2_RHOJO|nr:MFS transporter [Rhodococcus jostii]SED27241.1 Sugar phosphate permease [Rhodococcus jostii]
MTTKETAAHADDIGGSTRIGLHVSARTAWSVTFMVMVFQMINYADKAVLGVVARPLAEDLGLSNADIGLLGSAFFILFSVTGVIGGFVADRVKIVWMLLGMAVLWSLLQVPIMLMGSFGTLIVCRILLGAAEGPAASLNSVAVFGWFPKNKRGLPASVVSTGGALAKVLMLPALAVIVAAYGWRAAFFSMVVIGLVWSVVWFVVGKDGPYSVNTAQDRARSSDDTGKVTRVSFWRIAVRPTFWGGALGMLAVYGFVAVVLTWLPSYFEQGLGFSRLNSGFLFALPSITGVSALLLSSIVSDRLANRGFSVRIARGGVATISLLICGGMLVVLPDVAGTWTAVLLVVIAYGAGYATVPLMHIAVSHICPERQVASTVGAFVAFYQVAGLLAPWLAGRIIDAAPIPVEGYRTAFQVIGITAIVGAVLIALTVDPDRDRARIAAIDPLTHADGDVDDAGLLSAPIDGTTRPDRATE